MATKFFCIQTNQTDTEPTALDKVASLTAGDGSGLQVSTTNTGSTGGVMIPCTDTAGGTTLIWISNPVNAFTWASAPTANVWMAESNMSANVQARVECGYYVGTTPTSTWLGQFGTELPVTTRAAQNFACSTGASTAVPDGARLFFSVGAISIGSIGSGFTFTFGYNGTTGAADGDSWVSLVETVTEASATRNPGINFSSTAVLAKAWQAARRWHTSKAGILVPEIVWI